MSVAGTTRSAVPQRAARPQSRVTPQRAARPQSRVTPLRVVKHRRRISPKMLATSIVIVSMLVIVVGHALLAEGQVRLGKLQSEATSIQATNRATVLTVSNLETPERIARAAGSLHLVQPSAVIQLPSVPLSVPLAPIKIVGMTTP